MAGPARAGLFVYALDLERMTAFYEGIGPMLRLHVADDHVVLQSADIQLLVHRIPTASATGIVIASPPVRRDRSALKFFFTVGSLERATRLAASLGGEVFPEEWRGPGFVVRNACDPEGNVFQLRESL